MSKLLKVSLLSIVLGMSLNARDYQTTFTQEEIISLNSLSDEEKLSQVIDNPYKCDVIKTTSQTIKGFCKEDEFN